MSTKLKHALPLAIAAIVATAVAGAAGGTPVGRSARTCEPRLVGEVVHYCGPATARLKYFRSARFKHGSCKRTRSNGRPLFTVKLGTRTQDAEANDGLSYFGLSVSGSFSHPTGGGVIAYYKGTRWGGKGVSFSGNSRHGTFVAKGINGSPGRTSGSYRCS